MCLNYALKMNHNANMFSGTKPVFIVYRQIIIYIFYIQKANNYENGVEPLILRM